MTNPGGERNRERTGQRPLTQLSGIARKVKGVRHLDVDLYMFCPVCKTPTIFFEVKPVCVKDSEWAQVRMLAGHFGHGTQAALVVEQGERLGIKTYDSETDYIHPLLWVDEEYLIRYMEQVRDQHGCY